MDHVMSNFGNINYKTELEMKVSLLENENFELRGQLIDKLLIIKQLKSDSKGNPFPTDISTTTNTISNQPKTMITSTAIIIIIIIIITKTAITITTSTTITVKTRTMTTATTTKIKRTIITLMKKQFTTKSYKYNWRKFERKNMQIF